MSPRRTLTRRAGLATGLAFALRAPSGFAQIAPRAPVRLWGGFRAPVGMAFDAAGLLFITEWSAGIVSKIAPDGTRSIFAAELAGPAGLAIGADGAVYVGSYARDEIYRFDRAGGRSTHVSGLGTPAGLAFDRAGRLLIANRRSNEILALAPGGDMRPIIANLRTPVGIAEMPGGGYVVANIAGGITIVEPDGRRLETGSELRAPAVGLVVTERGRIFAADYGGTTVREIFRDQPSRIIADGLSSPVGLVRRPGGHSLLVATWGDGAVYDIAVEGL